MKIALLDGGQILEVVASLQNDFVLVGTERKVGVILPVLSPAAECAAYAINEGGELYGSWQKEGVSGILEKAFCVVEATSEELELLGLLDAEIPPTGQIRTGDGYTLEIRDMSISDGDLEYKALSEIGVDFALTSTILPVIGKFFLEQVIEMPTEALDDWYERNVGYRLSVDDPTLLEMDAHKHQVAEMMLLHQFGEGDVHASFLGMLSGETAYP